MKFIIKKINLFNKLQSFNKHRSKKYPRIENLDWLCVPDEIEIEGEPIGMYRKYFIVTDSLDKFLDFVWKMKMNPNEVFYCETMEEAIRDVQTNKNSGIEEDRLKIIEIK